VRQRLEQRRLQLFVPPRRLGLAGAFERPGQLLIELFDLAATLFRFELTTFGARGQLADDNRRNREGDERQPVVGIAHDHPAGRREEVVDEGKRRAGGGDEAASGSPGAGDEQHRQQQHRGGGTRRDRGHLHEDGAAHANEQHRQQVGRRAAEAASSNH
jgi:hypothetical protein